MKKVEAGLLSLFIVCVLVLIVLVPLFFAGKLYHGDVDKSVGTMAAVGGIGGLCGVILLGLFIKTKLAQCKLRKQLALQARRDAELALRKKIAERNLLVDDDK